MIDKVAFARWVDSVPEQIRQDPLWKSDYYRLAVYFYELVWEDCDLLKRDYRGREIVKQLIRSAGSISANIEEAFGRGVGSADHTRILRIALGEARETRGWYLRARKLLSNDLFQSRLDLLGQIIALLVKTISNQRKS